MRNRSYAILALAALAFAGCSKVEEFNSNPDSALTIESVGGVSQYALMQAQPASKAVIDGNTLPGSEAAQGIGIFVTASDGSTYDGHDKGYSNVKYSFDSGKWNTTTPIYLSNTVGKLYGYFPYNPGATNLKAIPVASSLNGTDYLYAEQQEVSFADRSVNLQMNHALARLHLTLKKGEKYKANGDISKITLKSTAIDASGTMDITTGEVSATKAKTDKGVVELAASGSLSTGDQTYDILLVPADASDAAKPFDILISIDGTTAGVTLSGENGITIQSGKQYDVTLTIEDTGIKVSGIGVGEWGEGGSQQVQVDGFTVTVKLSDDAADAGIAGDVLSLLQVNGSDLSIDTYSKIGKPVVLRMNGTSLGPDTESENLCTFTISDITSDITATLAYAKQRTVSFNKKVDKEPNVKDYEYGKVESSITVLEGRPSTLTATPGEGYAVYFNVKGTIYGDKAEVVIPNDVETIDAYFRFSDWLGGVFSVSKDTKVRFSRGNLWCEGTGSNGTPTIKSWGFESSQYSTPSNRAIDHISHFMWCKSASESVKLKYAGAGDDDNLFTNASPTEPNGDFAVNGQKEFWRVLSGGEWEYLLVERKTTYGTGILSENNHRYAAVKVNGMVGLLLFPDEFSWPTEAGDEPKTFNTNSSNWNGINYSVEQFKVLQDNGCVFLPAAGFRVGNPASTDQESLQLVNYCGPYWSSSPYSDKYIYCLNILKDGVDPSRIYNERSQAFAVRLVTDVK